MSSFHVLRSRTHFRRYRGRRLLFSYFAQPYSFSAVPRSSGPVFMFCARTHFWRYRGPRVPSPCFALPDSFSALSWASGPVFIFCAPRLVLGGSKGVGSRYHVFRARTLFRRYRRRSDPFSCFALPDSFLAVLRASSPVFMFYAPGLIFCGIEGVGSRFHILFARTSFRWYRGPRVPFSCFALADSFLAIPRASAPVFMFCATILIFGGNEGVGSFFHVFRSRTRFRRYRGRRVPFSCFALPDSFSAIPRASGPVCILCAPGLVYGGIEGVSSRFPVLRARTSFRLY
jgi:hypothetical protein